MDNFVVLAGDDAEGNPGIVPALGDDHVDLVLVGSPVDSAVVVINKGADGLEVAKLMSNTPRQCRRCPQVSSSSPPTAASAASRPRAKCRPGAPGRTCGSRLN